MTLETRAETFLRQIETRNRNPVSISTLKAYRSYIRTWIAPLVGAAEIADFKNKEMREFVEKMVDAGLKPSTVTGVTNLVKAVIASATDEDGEELYPRKWNNDFIDLPVVNPREQNAPIIARESLLEAISKAQNGFGTLYSLLAGSGLRVSECLALKAGLDDPQANLYLPNEHKLVIRGQIKAGAFRGPKTEAGYREVDLSSEICGKLRTDGWLFGEGGKPLPLSTAYVAAHRDGIPGFHSLRRFRVTYLRETGTQEELIKYWIGHSSKDITDRYSKLAQNVKFRKEWAEKIGVGF